MGTKTGEYLWSLCFISAYFTHVFVAMYTIIEPNEKTIVSVNSNTAMFQQHIPNHNASNVRSTETMFHLTVNSVRLLPDIQSWNAVFGALHLAILVILFRSYYEIGEERFEMIFLTYIFLTLLPVIRHLFYNDLLSFIVCGTVNYMSLMLYLSIHGKIKYWTF